MLRQEQPHQPLLLLPLRLLLPLLLVLLLRVGSKRLLAPRRRPQWRRLLLPHHVLPCQQPPGCHKHHLHHQQLPAHSVLLLAAQLPHLHSLRLLLELHQPAQLHPPPQVPPQQLPSLLPLLALPAV
jgi:hypothetical protein